MLKDKALASLSAGEMLLSRGLTDDGVSRYYYAMYRAAVHALTDQEYRPGAIRSGAVDWDHSMVENNVWLCRRQWRDRALYKEMRRLRVRADYGADRVSRGEIEAHRDDTRDFVEELSR